MPYDNNKIKIEEQEELYIVESIIDKRMKNNKNQYLVKWKDYSSDENTWEPEDNINCKELIEQFEEHLKSLT